MIQLRYIVDDVDASIEFYMRHLGFELKEKYGSAMAIVSKDGFDLWLAGPAASASKPMPDGTIPKPGGWNRLVVTVDSLDALYAELLELGVTFRNTPLSGPGGQQVLCEDPSGNPIELFAPQTK